MRHREKRVTINESRLKDELESLKAQRDELAAALDGLLDGLDANADPERCGISEAQWLNRIVSARAALAKLEKKGE